MDDAACPRPVSTDRVGNKDYNTASVVIIGAGIGGLCVAIDLIRRNKTRNFVILEKGNGIGGTWNDNRYPGCCCDIWSHLYSYSFDQNPDWTRLYASQEEILVNLQRVAENFDLYKHIRFNSEVTEAAWDESEYRWKTTVHVASSKESEFSSKYVISSDFLVSAVGQLNMPQYPKIPGRESFKGKAMHSARWDLNYDVRGKRIAVIGNGASSVQIIPELAKEPGTNITVFQRTPNWVIPRNDMALPAPVRAVFKYLPFTQSLLRSVMMNLREAVHGLVTDTEGPGHETLKNMALNHLKANFPDDPEMRAKLTPNYSIGCKRVLITDDYYASLKLPNVNLDTRPIERITESGIVVSSPPASLANKTGKQEEDQKSDSDVLSLDDSGSEGGEHLPFDLIVYATGFQSIKFLTPIKFTGTGGQDLSSKIWSSGSRAYLGVTIDSMPNFGLIYGPNTNLGHNSIVLMIETQSRYINGLIRTVLDARKRGLTLAVSPRPEVVSAYDELLQRELSNSSFADVNCRSWYKDEATGKITNNWSDTVVAYQRLLENIVWPDYEVTGTGAGGRMVDNDLDALRRRNDDDEAAQKDRASKNPDAALIGARLVRDLGARRAINSGRKNRQSPAVTHLGRTVEELSITPTKVLTSIALGAGLYTVLTRPPNPRMLQRYLFG